MLSREQNYTRFRLQKSLDLKNMSYNTAMYGTSTFFRSIFQGLHFISLTLSILFSIKLSKTWMASIFIPLYTMVLFFKTVSFSAVLSLGSSSRVVASWAVSSWVNGQMRTSKQETGTLLKRLTALLKSNLKIQYFNLIEWSFKKQT